MQDKHDEHGEDKQFEAKGRYIVNALRAGGDFFASQEHVIRVSVVGVISAQ